MRVVSTLVDDTGNLKGAYRLALGDDLSKQFLERARGLRTIIAVRNDPKNAKLLKNPNAIEPLLEAQNYTLEQLTNIQLVLDDLQRARRVASAADDARKSARPSGKDVFEEEAEGAPFRPDRLNLLNRPYTLFRNTYLSLQDRMSPRVAAELANMIYYNPDAAARALQAQIRRAQRVARPAGISRLSPAATGAQAAGYSSTMEFVPAPESEPTQ